MTKKIQSVLGAALLVIATACSSTPKATDSTAATTAPDARQTYAREVDRKLTDLEERNKKLKDPAARHAGISIKDARIELRELQKSTNPNWASYRSRLEGAVARIELEQSKGMNK
jgi:membrane-bound lytic murein transglycosylase B